MKNVGAWSSFPPPPRFYELWTDDPAAPLPPKPPPPIEGTYTLFGQGPLTTKVSFDTTLEEQWPLCKQLFSKDEDADDRTDMREEMKKLNRSLLFCFYDLLQLLVQDPTQCDDKIQDLELLQFNIHFLVNSYRPHEARQVLRSTMQQQIEAREEACTNLQQKLKEVDQLLDLCVHMVESTRENSRTSRDTENGSKLDNEDASEKERDSKQDGATSAVWSREDDLHLLQRALEQM